MRNLFYKRAPSGRVYICTAPATRWGRWRDQYAQGAGPLFWAAAALGAVGFYGLLWLTLALM